MPEEDTPLLTTNESGDPSRTPSTTGQELPDFLRARQELAENPQINEPKPEDLPQLTIAEKNTQNRLKEMLTKPDGEPETVFGLVNSMYSSGSLIEARTSLVINDQDNEAIRGILTQDTRDALDNFSAVNMLLKEYKLEAEGLPDNEEVKDLLSDFMVTQRHLIHLAGEMSANGTGNNEDLNNELAELQDKRFDIFKKLVANKDILSDDLRVKFIGGEQEKEPKAVEYPLAVRKDVAPRGEPRRPELPKPEDEEDSDLQEALDKIAEINPDELPEDKDELEQINEWMQTMLPDDIQEEVDEKYGVYQRLSKRVKENQDDLRLLRQATEYRLNTLKEILQRKGLWPENAGASDDDTEERQAGRNGDGLGKDNEHEETPVVEGKVGNLTLGGNEDPILDAVLKDPIDVEHKLVGNNGVEAEVSEGKGDTETGQESRDFEKKGDQISPGELRSGADFCELVHLKSKVDSDEEYYFLYYLVNGQLKQEQVKPEDLESISRTTVRAENIKDIESARESIKNFLRVFEAEYVTDLEIPVFRKKDGEGFTVLREQVQEDETSEPEDKDKNLENPEIQSEREVEISLQPESV